MSTTDAFDDLADEYDATFTAGTLGRRMRAAVWRRLDCGFQPGQRILELGCGTGEDALYLARRGLEVVAFDRSQRMVELARGKIESAGLGERVQVRRLAIEEWAARPDALAPPFDGALSNFGALNCIDDLEPAATALAASIRPGGRVVLVLMGPAVPWEWLWYLARLRPGKALRRFSRGGVDWRGLRVRYPGIGKVRRLFGASFRPLATVALGVFLPPSYAEDWAVRHPRWIAALDRLERRLEGRPPLPWLADHYLLELERRR